MAERSQSDVIESTWRETHETDEEMEESEKIFSNRSKWDGFKTKWDKRQKKHSYWRK